MLIPSFEKLNMHLGIPEASFVLEEFDKTKHMRFAEAIMDMDEELNRITAPYRPAKFKDNPSFGRVTYSQYIDRLLENNWRVFVALLNDICIGYIHAAPGEYKRSMYIGSFIITKRFTGRGYGRQMMMQFESLIRHDYDLIILEVAVKNKPAVKLYDNVGFQPSFMTMSKSIKA